MPDDETTTTTEAVQTQETTEQVADAQSTVQETRPHPLAPGGERWNEIYRERSDYKREAEALRAENDRLRQAGQPTQPQSQQKVWSEAELQGLVDQGKISPAQMSAQIAIQVAAATEQRIDQKYEQRARAESARADVNAYIAKVPALNNPGSPEFQRVATEAQRIAQDTGLSTADLRVQRLALAAALGPIDRITTVQQNRDFDRRHADTHTETGGGGGTRTTQTDPLKGVEPARIEFWKSRGYTREQMIEEAKFIRRPLRNR